MERQRRAKISVEVRSGTARFRVGVQAESAGKALRLVESRYSGGVVKVAFPTEQDSFFVHGLTHEAAA